MLSKNLITGLVVVSTLLTGCTRGQTGKISPSAGGGGLSSEPATTPASKSYTLQEVSQHATAQDCWLVIENKVYNVTDFVAKHPGGPGIVRGCGKDATTLFNERPTNVKAPHPAQAREQLKDFYIGDLQ